MSRLGHRLPRALRCNALPLRPAHQTQPAQNSSSTAHQFVPVHGECSEEQVAQLQRFVDTYPRLCVITGAGLSTESGIPDYRSEGVGLYATSDRRPLQIKEFLSSPAARRSFWARNYCGWPRFAALRPNAGHLALARWEERGRVTHLVTQNVDSLHSKAGSEGVTELHGFGREVRCMSCGAATPRSTFQLSLAAANPALAAVADVIRPDGDVQLEQDVVDSFTVPDCSDCGGLLKPFVVYFGDSVPRHRVSRVSDALRVSDAVLCVGTTLQVYSAYRFILEANALKLPMAAVNIGATRADPLLRWKWAVRSGDILPRIEV